MLSEKKARFWIKILIPILIMALSICVFSTVIPQTTFMEGSVESLERSKTTVMEFSGATLLVSLAITLLPDDIGTPIADSMADMSTYFVFILIAIFFERLIVVEGVRIAFVVLIPVACLLYLLAIVPKLNFIKDYAYKMAILAAAVIIIVPCSTYFVDYVGADYLAYVDETIDEANAGAKKINTAVENDQDTDGSFFEKLSNSFKTAMSGMNDLLAYFNNTVKKCYNSIAILIVTTFVMPVLMLMLFRWLLKELFGHNLTSSLVRMFRIKKSEEVAQ